MKKFLNVFVLFIIFFSFNVKAEEVTLKKCIDGDTADFNIKGKVKKVRFLAVDAPEIKHGDKKADRSELAQVAFTGDYNDLENKPTIPEEFTQQQVDWNATSGVTSIKNKPNLARVATTGSYNDLSDKLTAGNNITIENGVISAAGGGSNFDASRIKAGNYIILTYLDQNEQEVQSPQDAYYVKIDANIPAMEETISQWERVVANALARHEQAIQELQNA